MGEHERVGLARGELAQPRIDVAAEGDDLEILARGQQECPPAQAAGAHAGARGQGLQRGRAAQGVARVGARRDGDDGQAVGQLAGDVLGGVHGHVGLAVEQHLFERGHPA